MNRADILRKVNERGFDLVLGEDDERPARLTGAALKFPVVWTKDSEVSCEISWALAERLANGETNRVIY